MAVASAEGLDPNLSNALDRMIAASGGAIYVVSGFRSTEEQQSLWDEAVSRYGSEDAAAQWVARPGYSNHNKGTAVDLGGDLEMAAQLAKQFGLWNPMSWEPWHFELNGQPSQPFDPTSQTIAPGTTLAPGMAEQTDPMSKLLAMLGVDSQMFRNNQRAIPSATPLTVDAAIARRPPVVERQGDGATSNLPGDYEAWVAEVARLAGLSPAETAAFRQLGLGESSGQNIWQQIEDYNTEIGDPAFGPWQVIGSTFEAYKQPGYNDRFNPVHSGLASINYMRSRYGKVLSEPGY